VTPDDPSPLSPLPVELTHDEAPVSAQRPAWRKRAVVLGVIMALVGGAVALVLSRDGVPSPTKALAEVREFVSDEGTATWVSTSESTHAPKAGDLGYSSSSRSRATGELRLPDRAHRVVDAGDYAHELILNGNEQYVRSAGSRTELAKEQWMRWTSGDAAPPMGAIAAGAVLGNEGAFAVATAAGIMSTFACGAPLDLGLLFSKLASPERVAPNRIRATVKLAEVTPEPVRRDIERLRAELETAKADAAADGEGEDLESFDDAVPSLDGTLTVTIEYGPGGRLDLLVFDRAQELAVDRSTVHEEVRFADWGKPVTIESPDPAQVDRTPDIDEDGLAEVQKRYPVMAPTAPPAGWALHSVTVEGSHADSETCEAVELEYASADLAEAMAGPDAEDEPPVVFLATVAPDCEWLDHLLPDMSKARRVRVGRATARLVAETEDNYYSYISEGLTAVLELNGVTVVASSNLPEAQFLEVLKSLAPLDLSKQTIAPPYGG